MSRATDDLMDLLHRATAQQLAEIIQKGIVVTDKEGNAVLDEDGEPLRNPAPAAYIAAAIKFLKDNDITADPSADRFSNLQSALSEVPDFDEDSEYVN